MHSFNVQIVAGLGLLMEKARSAASLTSPISATALVVVDILGMIEQMDVTFLCSYHSVFQLLYPMTKKL